MITVEPKFYLIGSPNDTGEMITFLEENDIQWRLDPNISWAENVFEFAGRLCYASWKKEDGEFENLNLKGIRTGNAIYLKNIIESKHGSVFEHGGLILLFTNVSRVFTHELVRHRAGCAYSQTSGRFVRNAVNGIKIWFPDILVNNSSAMRAIRKAINSLEDATWELEKVFKQQLEEGSFEEKKELVQSSFLLSLSIHRHQKAC